MNAWIDKLLDMGLTIDAACWLVPRFEDEYDHLLALDFPIRTGHTDNLDDVDCYGGYGRGYAFGCGEVYGRASGGGYGDGLFGNGTGDGASYKQ